MLKNFKSTKTELVATRLSKIIKYDPIKEFDSFINNLISPGDICTTIDSNGETPLHISIQRNKMACLEKILRLDININSRNNKGYTPLHYALLYGHIKLASQFIKRGARVDEICLRKTGKTLLHKMILINKTEPVRLLLENGASVNKCNVFGMTPLHMAVISSNKTATSLLLEFGAAINQLNSFEQTALHIAIQMNQPEISKILINKGADLSRRDRCGKSMLNASISAGNLEICKQILKQHVINIDAKEKLLGRSPLHMACAIGSYPVTKLLLDYGANIEQLTRNHKAPIHVASEAGSTEIVKLFKEKSITLESKTMGHKTPLLLAVDGGHLQLAQYIIQSKGNIHVKDMVGATALHYATQKGLLQFTKLFVENGADINARDRKLRTPLHEAYIYGQDKVASYLREEGADQTCLDDNGMTPLDYKALKKLELSDFVSDISKETILIFIWLPVGFIY